MTGRRKARPVISRTSITLRSTGDCGLGLTRDPRQPDRMMAVLSLVDSQDRAVRVELTPLDVKHLRDDAEKLLDADAVTVAGWWEALTGIPPLVALDAADAALGTEPPPSAMPPMAQNGHVRPVRAFPQKTPPAG